MTEIRVAPLCSAQLDACAAVAAQAPDPWSKHALHTAMTDERRLCLAATRPEDEALLGFASLFVLDGSADLEMLVVDAAARRHGVAQRLLAAAQAELARRGARRLLLEVRRGNLPALGLYQKLGFRQLAVRGGMYAHPREDGLLLAKEL